MPPRVHAPEATSTSQTIVLPADEAAHLTRVLRLSAGDAVRVFDGRGHEWLAVVSAVTRSSASLRIEQAVEPLAEPRVQITLAMAALKGDKMDAIVRDAVMLGVRAIQPLITEHCEVSAEALQRGERRDRWQRVAVASAKQCGRAWIPEVREVLTFPELWSVARTRVLLAEPGADAGGATIRALRDLPDVSCVELLVGPEGGWTRAEIRTAVDADAILLTLGSLTLRAEAAPIVALTAIRVALGDF